MREHGELVGACLVGMFTPTEERQTTAETTPKKVRRARLWSSSTDFEWEGDLTEEEDFAIGADVAARFGAIPIGIHAGQLDWHPLTFSDPQPCLADFAAVLLRRDWRITSETAREILMETNE